MHLSSHPLPCGAGLVGLFVDESLVVATSIRSPRGGLFVYTLRLVTLVSKVNLADREALF